MQSHVFTDLLRVLIILVISLGRTDRLFNGYCSDGKREAPTI
jgi:hypothetical protein